MPGLMSRPADNDDSDSSDDSMPGITSCPADNDYFDCQSDNHQSSVTDLPGYSLNNITVSASSKRKHHRRNRGENDLRQLAIDEASNSNEASLTAFPRPIVRYEENVLVDSGASIHMTDRETDLTDVRQALAQVFLPDGSIQHSYQEGLMQVGLSCAQSHLPYVISLHDTLHVPGLRFKLWSVPAFVARGHGIAFTFNCCILTLNINGSNPTTIVLRHALRADTPHPHTAMNILHRRYDSDDSDSSADSDSIGSDVLSVRVEYACAIVASKAKKVPLELLHSILGHRAPRALIAASEAGVWADTIVELGNDDLCISCEVGAIRNVNRGKSTLAPSTRPGQVYSSDLIHSPCVTGLTPSSHSPFYFAFTDSHSRYTVFIGSDGCSADDLIVAVQRLATYHGATLSFSVNDIDVIHADAGSVYFSTRFIEWCLTKGIAVQAALPDRLHQNGISERNWQSIRVIAFNLLAEARLGNCYLGLAIEYAWKIFNVLPLKGLLITRDDGESHPSTPFEMYFGAKPRIGKFKVFGCPCTVKTSIHQGTDNRILNSKNMIQRGLRGIFVGFNHNQAGYKIFIPNSGSFFSSESVLFDQRFASNLSENGIPFRGARPERLPGEHFDPTRLVAFTGPPVADALNDPDDASPWGPHRLFPPAVPADRLPVSALVLSDALDTEDPDYNREDALFIENVLRSSHDPVIADAEVDNHYDVTEDNENDFDVPALLGRHDYDSDDDSSSEEDNHLDADFNDDVDGDADNEPVASRTTAPNTRSRASASRNGLIDSFKTNSRFKTRFANAISAIRTADPASSSMRRELAAAIVETIHGEPGADPLPFLPEPQRLSEILSMPTHIREPWLRAFKKEFQGLIRRNTVKREDPKLGDNVGNVMEVYKTKIDQNGNIEKLKCRIVYRGDLHEHTDIDTWNAHASWMCLMVFLAECARLKICPSQTDFVQAYLQADVQDRVFVKFPQFWAKFLTPDLAAYCGVPCRLLKGLYGYFLSGKLFWQEQADFFISFGLKALDSAPALWRMTTPDGHVLLVLQYSDDLLHACTSNALKTKFHDALHQRFDCVTQPHAHWYLQARISQDADFNITLDQQRYSKAIVTRYIPSASAEPSDEDCTKFASPLPFDFKWTSSDNSKTASDVEQLEREFGFKTRQVIGSFNFLGNTAYEELFAIRKACKHMHLPGRPHFKAILHLLHHIRCHPPQALKYYSDASKSPLAGLLREAALSQLDPSFILFTDSSWGDCDELLSTGCYVIFYQGGIVDMNSFVPSIIAQSSAESESNVMCVGAMAAANARMMIMELRTGDSGASYTVPMLVDSTAAIAINSNDKDTKRTRHIERRWLYTRSQRRCGHLSIHHVSGDDYQIADLGTKNVPASKANDKLAIVEVAAPL
jgi:hypothetical protein